MTPLSKKLKAFYIPKTLMIITCLLFGSNSFAYEKGTTFLRTGPASVKPQVSSGTISPAAISPNGQVDLDSNTQLGIAITHMLTNSIGLEVLAATPFTHEASLAGDLTGLGSIAEIKHLPPTISLQYYFNEGSNFVPYLGLGINYTKVLSADITSNGSAVLDSLGITDHSVDAKDSTGLAYQAGFDYWLGENWSLSAAAWKIDISTTVTVANAVSVDVDIDPLVYMFGLGYRF